jgi:hypothetical protein
MLRNTKFVTLWLAGGVAFLLGAMIAGNIRPGLGVEEAGLALALLTAFILFLVGGLLWISIAVAMKRHSE